MLICKQEGVALVPTQEQAPIDVCGNGDSYIAKVIGTKGDAEENDDVVKEKRVSPGESPIYVSFDVVFNVDLF